MASDKEIILPCPFCGSPASYDDHDTDHYGLDVPGVECDLCSVRNFADSEEEAIEAWNKRIINTKG
jgi:Lar family restriction alleviation protein